MLDYSDNISAMIDFWNDERDVLNNEIKYGVDDESLNFMQSRLSLIQSIVFNLQYLYNNGVCKDILEHYIGHWNYVMHFSNQELKHDLTDLQRSHYENKCAIVRTYIFQLELFR